MYKLGPRFLLGFSLAIVTVVGAAGCHREDPDAAAVADNSGPDPADANLAPVNNNQPEQAAAAAPAQGQVLGIRSQAVPQMSAVQYPPQQAGPPPPQDQDEAYQDAQAYDQLDQEGQSQPVEQRRRAAPAPARLRAAGRPCAQLHLDPRLLVLGTRRLLLDPRRLVRSTLLRRPLDPWLLGLVSQSLGFPSRLLGTAHRILRRHQLRVRLHRRRLLRWLLERP